MYITVTTISIGADGKRTAIREVDINTDNIEVIEAHDDHAVIFFVSALSLDVQESKEQIRSAIYRAEKGIRSERKVIPFKEPR